MLERRRVLLSSCAAFAAAAGAGLAASNPKRKAVGDSVSIDDLFAENMDEPPPFAVRTRTFEQWRPYWTDLTPQARAAEPADPPADADSVDYAQFIAGAEKSAASFEMTDSVFQKALAWTSIDPLAMGDLVLFGLRGARLENTEAFKNAKFSPVIALKEDTPNHLDFRCVIGVWDRRSKMFWAGQGSTVPHFIYLYSQRNAVRSALAKNLPIDKFCNMLATGVYRYEVGAHRNSGKTRQPGAFKLVDSVSVTRGLSGGMLPLTRKDQWDFCDYSPGNNIHAAMESANMPLFWSAGCQVLPGTYSNNRTKPIGVFRDFRIAAGLHPDPEIIIRNEAKPTCVETTEDSRRSCPAPGETAMPDGPPGRAYKYILITGREVRLAAENPSLGDDALEFARLRRGASGRRVAAMAEALKLKPSDTFNYALQRAYLRDRQLPLGLGGDGVFTPMEADRLGVSSQMKW